MDLDPNTGSYSGSYIIVKNINYSAALGLSPNGYFYYIGGTYGNSNGKFDLYAVKADGSTHTKVLNNYDGNGNNNNDLSFVRLGSTKMVFLLSSPKMRMIIKSLLLLYRLILMDLYRLQQIMEN